MINLFQKEVGRVQGLTHQNRMINLSIVVPFKNIIQPKFGEFLLVKESDLKGVVLRVISCIPAGSLKSSSGDEYQVALSVRSTDLSDTLRDDHLWYVYSVMVLGAIQIKDNQLSYSPGIRNVPHLGFSVCRPSDDALNYLANIDTSDTDPLIGELSIGSELSYFSDGKSTVPVHFDLKRLISKRTFVFSRAGYGKSNFVKLLITRLREQVIKEHTKCGILIFDPEGEYAFKTKAGLPGFGDLEPFVDGLVVFTNRKINDPYYKNFIGGTIKIDLRILDPREVADILFPSSTAEAQWKNIMMALGGKNKNFWRAMIDEISYGGSPDFEEYKSKIQALDSFGANSFNAFVRRLQKTVLQLHSSESTLLDQVTYHLKQGSVVIIDISILSDVIAGHIIELTLKKIFEYNQEKFMAETEGDMITTVIVVEEAQNSLGSTRSDDQSPVVRWAKEGRKYNLGGIYITQQPSALAKELLSQGDNYFAMHLINHLDLDTLQKVNAHFSEDILTYLMGEPIRGNAYFWSAPYQPYVINVKIDQYENRVKVLSDEEKAKYLNGENEKKFASVEFKEKEKIVAQEFIKRIREGYGLYTVADSEGVLNEFTKGKKALAIKPFYAREVLGGILRDFEAFKDLLTLEDSKEVAPEQYVIALFDEMQLLIDKRFVRMKQYGGKKGGVVDYFLLLSSENLKIEHKLPNAVIPVTEQQ